MNSASSVTHPSLVSGLRAKDATSWDHLVDLFGPVVFAMCRRQGLSSEAAADVMQETFLSVSQSIGKFEYRNSRDTFRGWLRCIAQHRIADYHRRRSEVLSAFGGSTAHQSLQNAPDQELKSEDEEAFQRQQLSGLLQRAAVLVQNEVAVQSWNAFWITSVEGRNASQAAKELGMQPAAVRKAKSRIARRLREVIGDLDCEPDDA